MPYAGASDASLPSTVRKLPKALRELWVRVFNDNYDAQDEGRAFRIAWGVVRRVQSAKKARLLQDVNLMAWRAQHEVNVTEPEAVQLLTVQAPATLSVKAMRDGRLRWALISSGAFRDRDGEIVSGDFLRDAVAFAEEHALRGDATIWHLKGTQVGRCDAQELVGEPPVLFETGLFDDTPAGRRAAKYYATHAPDMGASLEFMFSRRTAEGIYEPPGVIVRRSFLPRERAAFPWSAMQLKESTMAKTRAEQIAHLAAVMEVSEEDMTRMLEHIEAGTKTLAELGVDHKAAATAEDAPVDSATLAIPATEKAAETEPPAPVEVPVPELAAAVPEPIEATTAPVVPNEIEVLLPPATLDAITQQVLATLDSKLQSVQSAVEALVSQFSALSQTAVAQASVVKELETAVKELKTTDDAKIAAAVANLPRATVKSLQLGERPTQRTPEATDAPQESMLARGKATLFG